MSLIKEHRRRRIRRRPLPPHLKGVIDGIPLLSRLPSADQEELEASTKILMHEKHFEGAGGLTMNDEIKATISAQAALLILRRPHDYYPRLVSIIVYPGRYVAPHVERQPSGVVIEGRQVRAGESWSRGAVVLSWEDVRADAAGRRPGRNVVLHEFAHQLDAENGEIDGVPLLPANRYSAWARVLNEEYARLRAAVEEGAPAFLDPYGATSPAEFFAVATERFFTAPVELRNAVPELYAQLQGFYRQDPARLFELPYWTVSI